jgi:SET domain-containing protein
MYTQYLESKNSKTGTGLFTKCQIPANVPIMEFTGTILAKKDLPVDNANYVQIGPTSFLDPNGTLLLYINHSCNPNCMVHVVGNRAVVYSLYVIQADAELTYDYSTTSTDTHDEWKMECKCESHNCRGTISGFQYLSEDLKKDYTNKDLVPLFLKETKFI